MKLTAEVIVEVLDETALEHDAIQAIGTAHFVDTPTATVQQTRTAEVRAVTGHTAAAVQWLAEPYSIINSPRADVVETTLTVDEVDERGILVECRG